MNWIFVGSLGTGERVYIDRNDYRVAVERDHAHLVEPTPSERAEIMETMCHVRDWIRNRPKREVRDDP